MLRWIRSAFLDNLGLKLFAFILALILYRYVKGDQDRISTVAVKLLVKPPKGFIQTSRSLPSNLMVTLRGPESQLSGVDRKILRYTLDLSNAAEGPSQIEFYTDQLRSIFPPDVRVIRITPSIIDIVLRRLEKRFLPVRVRLKGKPLLGYRLLLPVQPAPLKVPLEGPKRRLDRLRYVETEQIDLTGQARESIRNVKLIHPAPSIRFLGTRKVRVKLQFLQVQSRRVFKDVPVKLMNFLNPKMNASLKPDHIKVEVFGPLAQIHPLKVKDITAEVNGSQLSNRPPGEYPVKVSVHLPAPDITASKAQKTVNVILTLKQSAAPEKVPDASDDDDDPPAPRKRKRTRKGKKRRKRRRIRKRKRPRKRPRKRRKRKRKKAKARTPANIKRRRAHRYKRPGKPKPIRKPPSRHRVVAKRSVPKKRTTLARPKKARLHIPRDTLGVERIHDVPQLRRRFNRKVAHEPMRPRPTLFPRPERSKRPKKLQPTKNTVPKHRHKTPSTPKTVHRQRGTHPTKKRLTKKDPKQKSRSAETSKE
ncbi:MAG TPA: hypothetical protein DCE42_16705 [Myxococcales bacterium]|nr:hypothetical protein [Deltaproteobacteria bacterium]MBU48309.1 hypothetical protein [Deltaproteobacteria bacterium]HAA56408.1 hypothetical protein [Myxococcales bacterium]|tara:strand:+ start:11989 stop:13587 length:1599 start_codon:yes stop_codon:yes gene_type:complete